MKLSRVILTVLSAIAFVGQAPRVLAEDPAAGTPAPAYSLVDLDGKKHESADFKGKFVVLEWNNFDCPFVARHYKSGAMPEAQKKYTAAGVVWLTVNSNAKGKPGYLEPAEMKARAAKEGFAGSAYVYDTDGTVGKAFGAPVTPTMVVIDKDGKIAYRGAIDDKPQGGEGAKNLVAAALDALLAGKDVEIKQTKPYGCGVKY